MKIKKSQFLNFLQDIAQICFIIAAVTLFLLTFFPGLLTTSSEKWLALSVAAISSTVGVPCALWILFIEEMNKRANEKQEREEFLKRIDKMPGVVIIR